MVRSESKEDRILESLSCSERAEFKDDAAVSRDTNGSKSLHFIFYSGKLSSPPLAIVTRVKLLQQCIEITD